MTKNTSFPKREFAKIRRIHGSVPHQSRTVTLGDLLVYNTARLIQEEAQLSQEELTAILVSIVPNGVKYTLIVYAPRWRTETLQMTELDYFAELQILTTEDRMNQFRYLTNGNTILSTDLPRVVEKWWEIPDDVVVGIEPLFASEEESVVDRD